MSQTVGSRPSLVSLYASVLTALWNFHRPFAAVFILAIGFHIAAVLRLPVILCWLPGAVLAIGLSLLWLLTRIPQFRPRWSGRTPVATLLTKIPGGWRADQQLVAQATFMLVLLCTLPAPVGVIASATVTVFVFYFFARPSSFYQVQVNARTASHSLEPHPRTNLILWASVSFFAVEAIGLVMAGLSFHWSWRACAVVSLLIAAAYVAVVAGQATLDAAPDREKTERTQSAPAAGSIMEAVPLLVAPTLISFWSSNRIIFFALASLLTVGAPLASFYLAQLRYRQATRTCRNALQSDTPDRLLEQAADSSGNAEDEVLGSDGYYRILRPGYIPLRGSHRTEAGFASWLKRSAFNNTSTAAIFGTEWIVVRGISGIVSPITRTVDAMGELIHALLGRLIPVGDHKSLSKIAELYDQQTRLDIVRNESELRLLKCPWDNAEILMLPLSWQVAVSLPPGSGLFDKEDHPCFANHVQMRIDIRPNVRQAVEAVKRNRASAAEIALVRRLLALFQRIFPSCFETLLMSTIVELRKHKLELLEEPQHAPSSMNVPSMVPEVNEQRPAAPRAAWYKEFCDAVEERLRTELPKEISELVNCRVGQIPINSYLLAEDTRKRPSQIRADEGNLSLELQKLRKAKFDLLEQQLLGGSGNRRGGGEVQLAKSIVAELARAGKEIEDARSKLLDRFDNTSESQTIMDRLHELQREVSAQTATFLAAIEKQKDEVEEAFSRFNDAFGAPGGNR